MTDKLVERLRKYRDSSIIYPSTFGEAADALEERGKRIDELESRLIDKDARIAELEAALKEVRRRTGLLMTQNQGRWNMSLEHDRRTTDVLSVNQDIARAALEKKND